MFIPTGSRSSLPSPHLTSPPKITGTPKMGTIPGSIQTNPILIEAVKLLNIPSSPPPATLTTHRYEQIKLKPEVEKSLNPEQMARLLELGETEEADFSKEIGQIARQCKIPQEPFFHNCDIIIFPDSFKGVLPENAVKQSDFAKIEKILHDILHCRGIFKIEKKSLKTFQPMLASLLLTNTGRTLLLALEELKIPIKIKEGPESCITFRTESDNTPFFDVKIEPDKEDDYYSSSGPDGTKNMQKSSHLVTLYHELSHITSVPLEVWKTPLPALSGKLLEQFHKETELRNILGISSSVALNMMEHSEKFFEEEYEADKMGLVTRETSGQFTKFQGQISQEQQEAKEKMAAERELKKPEIFEINPELERDPELEAEFRSFDIDAGKERSPTFENALNFEMRKLEGRKDDPHKDLARVDHIALNRPTNLKLNPSERPPFEIFRYFYSICYQGNIKAVKEFLDINKDEGNRKNLQYLLDMTLSQMFESQSLSEGQKVMTLKTLISSRALPLNYQVDTSMHSGVMKQNLFEKAVSIGFLGGIKYLLTLPDAKEFINKTNSEGGTLLHLAFSKNEVDIELIKCLIRAGVNPSQKNNDGYTALVYAEAEKHFELYPYLSTQDPGIAASDSQAIATFHPKKISNTSLNHLISISNGGHLEELQKFYMEFKDLSKTTFVGKSVLQIILERNKGNVKALQDLIASGLLPLNSLINKKNIIQFFIEKGFIEEIEFLLSLPAIAKYINEPDADGNTALHLAMSNVSEHRDKIIQILLKNNATDPLKNNKAGISPLQLAISEGEKELFISMLENLKPEEYPSALINCIKTIKSEFLEIFIKHLSSRESESLEKARESLEKAAIVATMVGNADTIKRILGHLSAESVKNLISIKSEERNSPLYSLLENDNLSDKNKYELVEYFMKIGLLPSLTEKNKDNVSVLELLMKKNLKPIFLLVVGKLKPREFNDALDIAGEEKNNEYLMLLLKNTPFKESIEVKESIEDAAKHVVSSCDPEKIQLVMAYFIERYGKTELADIRELSSGKKLLHLLLDNVYLGNVAKGEIANLLISCGIKPELKYNFGEGDSFDETCPKEVKEAMVLLKKKSAVLEKLRNIDS